MASQACLSPSPVIRCGPFQGGGSDEVLRCLFCCQSFGDVYLMFVQYILDRLGLLNGQLLENSYPLGWSFVLIVVCLFVFFLFLNLI